jgi:hypothetical protein
MSFLAIYFVFVLYIRERYFVKARIGRMTRVNFSRETVDGWGPAPMRIWLVWEWPIA